MDLYYCMYACYSFKQKDVVIQTVNLLLFASSKEEANSIMLQNGKKTYPDHQFIDCTVLQISFPEFHADVTIGSFLKSTDKPFILLSAETKIPFEITL